MLFGIGDKHNGASMNALLHPPKAQQPSINSTKCMLRHLCTSIVLLLSLNAVAEASETFWSSPPGGFNIEAAKNVYELNLRARFLHGLARFDEAAAVFETAREAAPKDIATLIGLADVYLDLGRQELALNTLEVASSAAEAREPTAEATQRLVIGRLLAKANAHDQAREQYRLAVTRAQDAGNLTLGVRIYIDHGSSFTQDQQFTEAAKYFAAANRLLENLDVDGKSSNLTLRRDLMLAVAVYEIAQGNTSNAAHVLSEVLDSKVEPDSLAMAQVTRRFGNLLVQQGDIDQAAVFLDMAIRIFVDHLGPDDPKTKATKRELEALGSPT